MDRLEGVIVTFPVPMFRPFLTTRTSLHCLFCTTRCEVANGSCKASRFNAICDLLDLDFTINKLKFNTLIGLLVGES